MLLLKSILNEDIDGILLDEKQESKEAKKLLASVEPIKPKRCQNEGCKAKLMLIDFPCKCKKFYCSQHRYSESHKCTFDYKDSGVKLLEKQLVEVKGSKLDKI